MSRIILHTAFIIGFLLTLNINSAYSQFQTFPQVEKYSLSGEKIKSTKQVRKNRDHSRYIENGGKKKKIKTKRKFVRNHSCSNFQVFQSDKTTRRNRTLSRKRRRLS